MATDLYVLDKTHFAPEQRISISMQGDNILLQVLSPYYSLPIHLIFRGQ